MSFCKHNFSDVCIFSIMIASILPSSIQKYVRENAYFISMCCFFALFGFLMATWIGRIPAIHNFAQLTTSTFAIALLGKGIGSVIVFPFAATMIENLGAKKATRIFGTFMILSVPVLGLMPNFWLVTIVLFFQGALTSCFDISINSLGGYFEKLSGKSRMAVMHAWFAVGSVGGSLVSGLAENIGLSPFIHFSIIAVCLILVLWFFIRFVDDPETSVHVGRKVFVFPHGGLLLLGLIGFFASVTESSISNWSVLYFSDYLKTDQSIAPFGYALYATFMFVGRLIGDILKNRFGASKVLMTGNSIASIGLLFVFFSSNFYIALMGFAITGFGVSTVFPFLFSAASKQGSVSLASVATLGYIGGIAAPPLIGAIVTWSSLSVAMLFLSVVTLTMATLASQSKMLKEN